MSRNARVLTAGSVAVSPAARTVAARFTSRPVLYFTVSATVMVWLVTAAPLFEYAATVML